MDEERDASNEPSGTARSPDGAGHDANKTCAQCGEPIDTSDWYPIRTDRDADGSLRIHPFCSEDCRAAWLEEREE